jgi:peptidyl-prolyl cis-trans isomerase A (cyclophilin A)
MNEAIALNRVLRLILPLLLMATSVMAQNPRVVMETDRGAIFLELDAQHAPISTENFLAYVDEDFYQGLVFHLVYRDSLIEAGAYDREFDFLPPTQADIPNENQNGLFNVPRTIAVERSDDEDPDSGNSQFFINLVWNKHLDGAYTVFGQVIGGWKTVVDIASPGGRNRQISSRQFLSAPILPPRILRTYRFNEYPVMAVHSGSWFDPQNPGVGFNLEVTNQNVADDRPTLVLYWYDFSQGEPLWLTGSAGFDWGDDEVTVELLAVPTPNVAADFQSPPAGAFQPRGTITINFNDCATGRFSYDLPEFGSGEIDVLRLSVPDRINCENYQLDELEPAHR